MSNETPSGDTLPSGKFANGNQAGKGRGNPHAARVTELRAKFYEAVTDEQFLDVVHAMLAEAKAGNVKAAEWIAERLLGKSPQAVELSGADGGPAVIQLVWPEKPA